VSIQSLGKNAGLAEKSVAGVKLLGNSKKLKWKQEGDALVIQPPAKWPCQNAVVFAIKFAR
jgi:alpha-L-fucosidase